MQLRQVISFWGFLITCERALSCVTRLFRIQLKVGAVFFLFFLLETKLKKNERILTRAVTYPDVPKRSVLLAMGRLNKKKKKKKVGDRGAGGRDWNVQLLERWYPVWCSREHIRGTAHSRYREWANIRLPGDPWADRQSRITSKPRMSADTRKSNTTPPYTPPQRRPWPSFVLVPRDKWEHGKQRDECYCCSSVFQPRRVR